MISSLKTSVSIWYTQRTRFQLWLRFVTDGNSEVADSPRNKQLFLLIQMQQTFPQSTYLIFWTFLYLFFKLLTGLDNTEFLKFNKVPDIMIKYIKMFLFPLTITLQNYIRFEIFLFHSIIILSGISSLAGQILGNIFRQLLGPF